MTKKYKYGKINHYTNTKRILAKMLAELKMDLETDRPDLGYYQSSNMQGILMEQIDTVYADKLHDQGLKPYSQLLLSGEPKQWIIKTFTQEAYQEIILPLLDKEFSQFTIEKKAIHITVRGKSLKTLPKQELLNEFYTGTCRRHLDLEFLTPTAFKSGGRYIIIPDTRYIYQNLMNKYSAASPDLEMYDPETLEQLTDHSNIVQYRLKSVLFPIEGVKIPAFKGMISIKITGTDTMARYARLLARFGEYSGVGIKSAMGMGGLKIKEWGQKNDR